MALKTKSEEIATKIKALGAEVQAIYKGLDGADPSGEDRTAVAQKRAEMDTLHAKYLEEKGWEEGIDGVKAHLDLVEGGQKSRRDYGDRPTVKTLGDILLEDNAFKSWFTEKAKLGGPEGTFRSPSVTGMSLRSLLTGLSDASAGAFVRREYDDSVMLPMRTLNIRDIVTVGETGSDTIEYVRETTRTNNAAVVAEATATAGSSGASPESALGFEQETALVKDLTTWIPVTRRALADAGQLRTLADTELRYMLASLFESEVVAGVGTGQHFTGIVNTSGLLTQAWSSDRLTTTRKARTKCTKSIENGGGGAKPNAWLLNPDDIELLDLEQDNEGRYYWGGPAAGGVQSLWRVPVIEHEDVPAGTGLIGDFRTVRIWDRQQAAIYTTDSHSDFFIRSINVMLAVARAAMAVKRPAAITSVDLTA